MRNKVRGVLLAILVFGVFVQAVNAQTYPTKAVTMVVGFPPGGGADILGRLAAQTLSQSFGQQVIVDNRPGAGSNIATSYVAKARADGYTLMFHSVPFVINPHIYKSSGYDVQKDFSPIVQFAAVPLVLATSASLPVTTTAQLIDYAKRNSGKVNYGSAGNGTSSHLAAELFKSMAGVELVHVPYKGAGPLTTALLGGEVQATILNAAVVAPHVSAGKLRALAVTSAKRSPLFPTWATISEAIPGYDVVNWFGLFAPAGTPTSVITSINAAINKALTSDALIKELNNRGAVGVGGTPSDFSALVNSELETWGKMVKATGARID